MIGQKLLEIRLSALFYLAKRQNRLRIQLKNTDLLILYLLNHLKKQLMNVLRMQNREMQYYCHLHVQAGECLTIMNSVEICSRNM